MPLHLLLLSVSLCLLVFFLVVSRRHFHFFLSFFLFLFISRVVVDCRYYIAGGNLLLYFASNLLVRYTAKQRVKLFDRDTRVTMWHQYSRYPSTVDRPTERPIDRDRVVANWRRKRDRERARACRGGEREIERESPPSNMSVCTVQPVVFIIIYVMAILTDRL